MSDNVPRQPQQPQAPLERNHQCARCQYPEVYDEVIGREICWPCFRVQNPEPEDPNHPCPRCTHAQVFDQAVGGFRCRQCQHAWAHPEEPRAPPRGAIPRCPRCQQPQRFYGALGGYGCADCALERDGEELPAIPVCQAPGCNGYELEFDELGQPHCFWCDLRAREAEQQIPNPPANDQEVEEWPQHEPPPRNPPQAAAPAPNQAPLNRQGQRPAGNAPRQVNQNPIQDPREQDPEDSSSDEFVPWIPPTPESRRQTWIRLFGDPYLDSDPEAPMQNPPRMPAPMEHHQAPTGPNQVLLNRQGQREDGIAPRQAHHSPIQHPQVQDTEDSSSDDYGEYMTVTEDSISDDYGEYMTDTEEENFGAPMQSPPRMPVPMQHHQAPTGPNQVLLNRQGQREDGIAPRQVHHTPIQHPQVQDTEDSSSDGIYWEYMTDTEEENFGAPMQNPPRMQASMDHRQGPHGPNQGFSNRPGRPQMPAPRNLPYPLNGNTPVQQLLQNYQNPRASGYSPRPPFRPARPPSCRLCFTLPVWNEETQEYQCMCPEMARIAAARAARRNPAAPGQSQGGRAPMDQVMQGPVARDNRRNPVSPGQGPAQAPREHVRMPDRRQAPMDQAMQGPVGRGNRRNPVLRGQGPPQAPREHVWMPEGRQAPMDQAMPNPVGRGNRIGPAPPVQGQRPAQAPSQVPPERVQTSEERRVAMRGLEQWRHTTFIPRETAEWGRLLDDDCMKLEPKEDGV